MILVDGVDDFGPMGEDGQLLAAGSDFRIDSDRNDRNLWYSGVQLPHGP